MWEDGEIRGRVRGGEDEGIEGYVGWGCGDGIVEGGELVFGGAACWAENGVG